MPLGPDQILLHYRLVDKLGEGGMGVVWRAVDTTLDREVAIKVLADAFVQDPDRLARFEREAKLLASLNHPNVASVYSVHEAEGLRFLALELVPGEDLSQRMARGPLPQEEALRIGLQVAEALEAAHESGVIHRDLKPANVQLTPEGKVKVLDFGLAKALDSAPSGSGVNPTLSPTLTSAGTVAGMILGTAAYMSPEQAHGRAADRRADVWSFGCLMYEMLSGQQAFRGESISDTLASVLKLEPDQDALRDTPARVAGMVRRCLVKDPLRRLQAIGEARIVIEDQLAGRVPAETAAATPAPAREQPSALRRLLPWVVAIPLALVLGAVLWNALRPGPEPSPPIKVKIRTEAGRPMRDGLGASIVLSPDGRRLAYVSEGAAESALWVRDFSELEPRQLSGTLGASSPFFSPDGESVGFFAGGQLKSVPVSGGAAQVLAPARSARGGTWCADGSIVYSPDVRSGLYRLPPGATEPEVLTRPDRDAGERSHRWPHCFDGGKSVVFLIQSSGQDYDDGDIDMVRVESKERLTVHRGGAYPRVLADRYLLFARKGQLFVASFDAPSGRVTGRPRAVLEDLMSRTGDQAAGDGSAQYAISQSGLLIYRSGWEAALRFPMVWVDRQGKVTPAFDQPGTYTDPRISPDGRQIAVTVISGLENDIWVLDIGRGAFTRLTFGEDSHYFPAWSPDSQLVSYSRDTGTTTGIYTKRADGSGAESKLFEAAAGVSEDAQQMALSNPCSWSPDGEVLGIHEMNPTGGWDLAVVRLDGSRSPQGREPILSTPYDEVFCAFSPDGRLLAYQSNESGGWQIYVRSYPDTGGRWQVSIDGGMYPRWSGDGSELFFRWGSAMLSATVSRQGDGVNFGNPAVLFEGDFVDMAPFSAYDVSPDGQRFLMFPAAASSADDPSEAILVLNWLGELDRLDD